MAMIIPPGGMAGFSQMTPASRIALTQGAPRAAGSRRRRRAKTKKAKMARRAKRVSRGRKMKFGSPAWQRKYKVGRFAKKRRR